MSQFELAQLNIARMIAPLDSPELADFVANLDQINEIADQAPGFVWRFQTDDGNATGIRPFGDDVLVNFSVWRDAESLHQYVYKSAHAEIMARRREWFSRIREAYSVLWWVAAGHRPTIEEASQKLKLLQQNGPSADAFTFKQPFPAPAQPIISETSSAQ